MSESYRPSSEDLHSFLFVASRLLTRGQLGRLKHALWGSKKRGNASGKAPIPEGACAKTQSKFGPLYQASTCTDITQYGVRSSIYGVVKQGGLYCRRLQLDAIGVKFRSPLLKKGNIYLTQFTRSSTVLEGLLDV